MKSYVCLLIKPVKGEDLHRERNLRPPGSALCW